MQINIPQTSFFIKSLFFRVFAIIMARILKLTPLYFIKYVLTAYHFRSNMMSIARNNILIKKIHFKLFLRLPRVGSGTSKKIGSGTEEKNYNFFKDQIISCIVYLLKVNLIQNKSSQTSFFIFLTSNDLLFLTSDDLR